MYSIRNILVQEPNAVRGGVLAVLAVLVMTQVVTVSAEAVAGIGLAVEVVLNLFYVKPLSVSRDAMSKLGGKK